VWGWRVDGGCTGVGASATTKVRVEAASGDAEADEPARLAGIGREGKRRA
jgi:hypothetical protein